MFADQLVASGWETLKLSECIHHLGKAKVKKTEGHAVDGCEILHTLW